MFRKILLAVAVAAGFAAPGLARAAVPDLIAVESAHSVEETAARLTELLEARGVTVFAVIDHAAGAASVGRALRPTTLVIFGNPALGAPLMAAAQTAGVDLPQKALIYEDAAGAVWLAYNDPAALARRHGIPQDHEIIGRIAGALSTFAQAAVGE